MLILLKTHARHEFNSIQFIYIKFTVQLHTLIWLVKAALNEIMWPAEKIYKIHWLHYVLNRTYSSKNVHFIKYSISFIIWYYFNLQNQHRPQTNGTFAHANVKKEKKAKPKPNQKNVNQYFLYLNHPIKQLTVTLDQNISKRKTRNRCVFIRHCIEMDTEICRKNRLAKILNLLEMRVNIREREAKNKPTNVWNSWNSTEIPMNCWRCRLFASFSLWKRDVYCAYCTMYSEACDENNHVKCVTIVIFGEA